MIEPMGRAKNLMNTEYWKEADRSNWTAISRDKYLDMLTQLSSGLLASGHFTNPFDPYNSDVTGLKIYKAYHGYYASGVEEAAQLCSQRILNTANMLEPECEDPWEMPE
jgi:hypothetical protein